MYSCELELMSKRYFAEKSTYMTWMFPGLLEVYKATRQRRAVHLQFVGYIDGHKDRS